MLQIREGDAFSCMDHGGRVILAHGVNCQGKFASGFAKQVAIRYPVARQLYLQEHQIEPWYLTKIQVVKIDDYKWIANCATQDQYGYDGGVYVDYAALKSVINSLSVISRVHHCKIHMPMIGCGLAGGDENKLFEFLEHSFKRKTTHCTVWRKK